TPSIFAADSATAPHPFPATRMWTSPPICCAAVMALRVAAFSVALSCSARTRELILSPLLHCAVCQPGRRHRPLWPRPDVWGALQLSTLPAVAQHPHPGRRELLCRWFSFLPS